jgi:isocitrate dehydrogenase (NAD+)
VWGRLYHGAFMEVAAEFPDIQADHRLVDATNMFLALAPQSWGVIVTENMFGDILADHLAALMGGLGVAPGANIGDDMAVFEAVHGSWPQAAGRGIANPCAITFSACMLLEHIGMAAEGHRLRETLIETLKTNRTGDLGGKHTTDSFTQAVLARL